MRNFVRTLWLLPALLATPGWAGDGSVIEVISAGSIVVAGERLQLQGVVAPGLRQECIAQGFQWRCGFIARLKLQQRLASSDLTCVGARRDQHGQRIAICVTQEDEPLDLGGWLVSAGWALADVNAMPDYAPLEDGARAQGLGIWKGGFTPDVDWIWFARNVTNDPADTGQDCSSCSLRHQDITRRIKVRSAD